MAYITRDELKKRTNHQSALRDEQLDVIIDAASDAVTDHCGRSFDVAAGSSTRVFRPDTPGVLWFDDATAVTLVETRPEGASSWVTLAASHYELRPLNGRVAGRAWPYYGLRTVATYRLPMGAAATVRITGTWGWAATPDAVREATLLVGAQLVARMQSPAGVLGFDGVDGVAVRVGMKLDPTAVSLLEPYRRSELWASA